MPDEERPGTIDEAVARVVREELRRMNPRLQRMKSREEAALYLNCSESSIDNLVAQKKLHPSGYLRWPMFDIDDLDRLIESTRRPS